MSNSLEKKYIYLGDRMTDLQWRNNTCYAVCRPDGKCIRGKNGNMLVRFGHENVIVCARLLRKAKQR